MTYLERELVAALENIISVTGPEDCGYCGARNSVCTCISGKWFRDANVLLARAKSTDSAGCDHSFPALPFPDPNCKKCCAKSNTSTRECVVSDDGHGRAMVEGKRLSSGGCGVEVSDKTHEEAGAVWRVPLGASVLCEFRPGTDFATLLKVL